MSKIFDGTPNQPNLQSPNVKLDLSQASDLECSKCGNKFFHTVYMFKQISALISPAGKPSIIPIETFACLECGNINKEFLPKNLNNQDTSL
jgi:uncharacterized Zn finger protein